MTPGTAFEAARLEDGPRRPICGCGRNSQFDEARSLCQSRHPAKAAIITTAAPGATNDAIIIATIATKASVIEVCRSSPGTLPGGLSWIGFQENTAS